MLLFDIDNTLLDHTGAEKSAATLFGEKYSMQIPNYIGSEFGAYWTLVSEKHMALFFSGEITFQEQRRRRIKDVFCDNLLPDEEADSLFSIYLEFYEKSWKAYPDVLPFFESNISAIGIISDGSQHQQEKKLQAIGIYSYVSFVLTPETTGMSKPDPLLFHRACELAGASPSCTYYVGDNLQKDVFGASSAGLNGVWLNRDNKKVPVGVDAISTLRDLKYG